MAEQTSNPDSPRPRSAGRASALLSPPELSAAKGGGSVKGLDDGFRANPVTGSASFSIPLPFSPCRGSSPPVSLSYDSSSGNGPFGLGWSLDVPSIVRQTSRRLPLYDDGMDSDVFSLSGFEDLVPRGGEREEGGAIARRYRPRIEGSFSRIERLGPQSGGFSWRVLGADGSASVYGDSEESRIYDPGNPSRVFRWLLSSQADALGNVIRYRYSSDGAQRYLSNVLYGSKEPFSISGDASDYHFELRFLYEERPDRPMNRRAGFAVPLSLRCREARMLHRFGAEAEPARNLSFEYGSTPGGLSLLSSATLHGRKAGGSEPLPPLSFEYGGFEPGLAAWRDFSMESAGDIPGGMASAKWADLWGEGLPGILSERGEAWLYKRNLGNGELAPAKPASPKPRPGPASGLLALEGDGGLWLAEHEGAAPGASRLGEDGEWGPRKPFRSSPNIDFGSQRVRFVDLDGDGRAEVMIDGYDHISYYPSEGSDGYGPAEQCRKDPREGPRMVARGRSEAVFIADMTGDGIPDIFRISDGEACYWPGLGHGRFGRKVVMDGSPRFGFSHPFGAHLIQLADLDGTGAADIIYGPHKDAACVWLNRGGHSLVRIEDIDVPGGGAGARLECVDLMGSGAACLVWSSAMAKDMHAMPKHLDLAGGKKPYAIVKAGNGMGREVKLEYEPSTKFYLEDMARGEPWATRLPYPVQCLSKVSALDLATGWSGASSYSYHHGCHDGSEREFRGFGRVDRVDCETGADAETDQAPVLTRSWFHLGVAPDGKWLPEAFAREHWRPEGGEAPSPSRLEPALEGMGLSPGEWREAHRAFKGLPLREEVYSLEGGKAGVPYLVTDHAYGIELLGRSAARGAGGRFQPAAVWMAAERETAARSHEGDEADPRIARSLVLRRDGYGRPTMSAEVVYGRKAEASHEEQEKKHVVVKETRYAADVGGMGGSGDYRMGMECGVKTWEMEPAAELGEEFGAADLIREFEEAGEVPFEAEMAAGQKRLVESAETLFYNDSLNGPLPLGEMARHGLPYETYSLAYTQSLLAHLYGAERISDEMLAEGGFIQRDGEWLARTGRNVYAPDAAEKFYLPSGVENAFGQTTSIAYDEYNLLMVSVTDPLGNAMTAVNDYRTLSPSMITDPNGNRTAVETDALGIVVKTAVMGKVGANEGDTLDNPTAVMEYGFAEFDSEGKIAKPSWIRTKSRETHGDPNTRWMETVEYSDGAGNVALAKAKTEPGTDGNPRWVGTGRTVLNNKGNPVKQYEPYFSDTDEWENEAEMREQGVTPVMHYDPLSRLVRTDFPDGTHSKVEFTAWEQQNYDRCDTAESSPHYDTPTVTHLDSLGRPFLVIANDGTNNNIETRTVLDIEGNEKKIIDARNNTVMEYKYGIHGEKGYSKSMDAGERWMLVAADGQPIYTWDSRGHKLHVEYDELRRPTKQWLNDNTLVGETVYGTDAGSNLIGQPWKIYDQSGMVENVRYDFKGNLLESKRQLTQEYKQTIDWSMNPVLETEEFVSRTEYDALNRAVSIKAPHNNANAVNEILPAYDEGGLLKAVKAKLRGAANETEFVTGISYNPKGQRERIRYGNGSTTKYEYDENTFRLIKLLTTRSDGAETLQDLNYAYDQMGNIVGITDDSQQTIFFNGQVVSPSQSFEYDALYRLTKATGREHINNGADTEPEENGYLHTSVPMPGDATALRNYAREWEYDKVGNIMELIHRTNGNIIWNRSYNYAVANNHLLSTTVGNNTANYTYNEHGSMSSMPHLTAMQWDFAERLRHITKGIGSGTTEAYYNYDGSGERTRKVVEKGNVVEERLYLGGFEIFRKKVNGNIDTERETLHIMDDTRRIAIVETKTIDGGNVVGNPIMVQRYQLSNNIESATLELDEAANIISYEEYYPYGDTSYQAGRDASEVSQKRYRYTGKEKDEESGFYYHGARYYACWLGRWISADPAGIGSQNIHNYDNVKLEKDNLLENTETAKEFLNLYLFVQCNPIIRVDSDGYYSMVQNEDGSYQRVHEDDEDHPNIDRVDEVFMNEEWMQKQMENRYFNPSSNELTKAIRTEWAEMARIVLNNEELFVDIANKSEEYEYGVFFNSEREPIMSFQLSESPVVIPFIAENPRFTLQKIGSTPNVGKLANDKSPTSVQIPREEKENEVHGHPNGIGVLSPNDEKKYVSDDKTYNMKLNPIRFVRQGNNMFVVGHKTGEVAVKNRKIIKFGLQQLPIGRVNMNNKRPVYYQNRK